MSQQNVLKLTGLSKELKVLLELLKWDNERDFEINRNRLFENFDWPLFLELAMHHRVYPLLFPKLKNMDEVPGHVKHFLKQQYRNNTFRMLQLSGEMEYLSRLFEEKNIRLLHLKGPVLAKDLYGELSSRTCGDLDMMVSLDDVENADQLLSTLGYVKDDYIETVLGDWKWRHHHLTYFHSNKPIKVEIHWRLNPGPGFEPRFNQLWERKRKIKFTNQPVYFLEKEDLFFFLVTHGARHGWSRLRWLTDIDQMLKQEINWKKLVKRMNQYHALSIGGQAIILSSNMFNTPISEEMRLLINGKRPTDLAQEAVFYFERMVNLHSYPVPDDVAVYHKKHLFSLMSSQQKALFMLSFLFPYPEDVHTLPLPKRLHFLYFPLRPYLWAWRRSTKQALPRRGASE